MSSETPESIYEPVPQSVSSIDIEIAEILQTISNAIVEIDSHTSVNTTPVLVPVQNPNPVVDIPLPLDSPDSPLEPIHMVRVSFVDLITKIILDHELQKKYDLSIDAKYIQYLQQMIEMHPDYLGRFETSVSIIFKDGRISIADIPEIVKLVTELYGILFSIHPGDILNLYAGILKPVFCIAIKEKVVIVENETEVIAAFDSFIDAAVELLKMQIQFTSTCSKLTCDFTHMWWFK